MSYPVALLLILLTSHAWAQEGYSANGCNEEAGAKVVSLQGTLDYDPAGKGQWQPVKLNDILCQGGRIRSGHFSRASLSLANGGVARVDQDTEIDLKNLDPEKDTIDLGLLKGFIQFISRTPKQLNIGNPIANAGPEGTEFAFSANENDVSLWVYEGTVKLFNSQGSIRLKPGEGGKAIRGQAPQARIDIRPTDAVNWALYYPPLVPFPATPTTIDASLYAAIQDYRHGRLVNALLSLDALPPDRRTITFYKVRSAIRLTAGRVDLATQDIKSLLALKPNDAEALALQAVIALTQNRKDEALELAQRGIHADPQSPIAHAAMSYVQQGRFELEKALESAETATKFAPHDAMQWARLAELQLALGKASASEQTVEEAKKRDADLERTQTVIGFNYLQAMEADDAQAAFENALRLDSTSPLARLGLGLAKIRNGDLAEGRQDLEIAATLDPNNSLIRSYLGKAYYEENRSALAEDQFKLAKERDPKDPTPYFYDALKKQTENRPVEALKDLQTAMDLNDNRAVYRSKQLLDSDRAARGASLAKIYDMLGFDQRGILEASTSLAIDPSNYSAHRFLSDSYVRFPARGAAQSSELLQAQLLQPININPIQPHLAVSNRSLPIGLSVSEPLFRDFTRLYERNRPQLTATGLYGNLDTIGDETVLSGIYNNFSYSFGQFHFSSDGFRSNADINHDVYNAFIQSGFTEKLNVQFQYLHRETNQGDLTQQFDPFTSQSERFSLNQDIIRGGVHYQPTHNIDLVATIAHSPFNEKLYNFNDITEINSSGLNGEVQIILKSDQVNFLVGGSAYERLIDSKVIAGFSSDSVKSINEGNSFYGYSFVKLPINVTGTFGFNYTYLNTISLEMQKIISPFNRWQPKLGLQWQPYNNVSVRFAYAESLKSSLFDDQSIEPSQIAGFNQLFDDLNGNASALYASAIDLKWSNLIYSGFQFNRRDIDIVEFNVDSDNNIISKKLRPKRQADSYQIYFNWLVSDNISVSAQYIYERDSIFNPEDGGEFLTTNKIPFSIRYFNPNGFFSQLGMTYVAQNNINSNSLNSYDKSESFILADAAVGYRFPNRLGLISLEVRNIFDKSFEYNDKWRIEQSDIFKMSRQQEFIPTRTILGRLYLNF